MSDIPRTWCPQCGFNMPVDEDGCCIYCGCDADGPGARRAVVALERAANIRAAAEAALAGEAAALERVAELEAENERLRVLLAKAATILELDRREHWGRDLPRITLWQLWEMLAAEKAIQIGEKGEE